MSLSALICLLSAMLLGLALHLNDGHYSTPAVACTALSFLLCAIGTLMPGRSPGLSVRASRRILCALAGALMLIMMFRTAGASIMTVSPADQTPYQVGVGIAVIALGMIGAGSKRVALIGFIALLVTHTAIGVWKIRSAPAPKIDVFIFQTDAPHALAQGINPYTITFENIYGPDTYVYGPGVVRDGRLMFGFPYPPLVLLWTAPAQLGLGDFRYAQLLTMLATAVLIALMRRDAIGMLAAAIVLFTPRGFYVLESGWTEPLSVMLLAGTIVGWMRSLTWTGLMLGLLIASKQYLPATALLLPLLARLPHGFSTRDSSGAAPDELTFESTRHGLKNRATIKVLTLAVCIAAIVTLPLALWDMRAFVHSTLTLQFNQPYRPDALSLLAWWGSDRPGWVGPFWLCFVALLAAAALSLWRARSFAAGFALCFFAFFIFNKQAFANYYYLVIGALCCAAACENFTPARRVADK
jgi:hypothetical protein